MNCEKMPMCKVTHVFDIKIVFVQTAAAGFTRLPLLDKVKGIRSGWFSPLTLNVVGRSVAVGRGSILDWAAAGAAAGAAGMKGLCCTTALHHGRRSSSQAPLIRTRST